MKKVARLRTSPTMSEDQRQQTLNNQSHEPMVRTTGRIKKPKAVFDPSDNYLPRAQRLSAAINTLSSGSNNTANLYQDGRNSLSRLSTASSDSNSLAKEVCVVCGKRESKRTSFAMKNPLFSCVDCESKIHRLCLKVDFDDSEHVRQTYRCESCTPCVICLKSNLAGTVDDNKILVCSKCAKVYHCQCLQESSTNENDDDAGRDWKCPKCTLHMDINEEDTLPVKKIREIIGDHSPPAHKPANAAATVPTLSVGRTSIEADKICPNEDDMPKKTRILSNECDSEQVSKIEDCREIEEKEYHENSPKPLTTNSTNAQSCNDIPDVHNWSVEQVFEYFRNNFPKEAHVFKDQEIDGPSLLLLTRSDVVKKLPLKLGPSLRLYSAILKIQGQRNDPTMGWNCSI